MTLPTAPIGHAKTHPNVPQARAARVHEVCRFIATSYQHDLLDRLIDDELIPDEIIGDLNAYQ
jgi:hypothetical protein